MVGAFTTLTGSFVQRDNMPFNALMVMRPGSYAPISPIVEISIEVGAVSMSEAKTRPNRSARGMNGFSVSLASPASRLTANGTNSPFSASCTMSATTSPARSCASRVLAPKWGVATTLLSANRGESVVGSLTKTSSAAPAMVPLRSASARWSSFTIPPRATLTMRSDGFARFNISASIIPLVSFVFGR